MFEDIVDSLQVIGNALVLLSPVEGSVAVQGKSFPPDEPPDEDTNQG